MMKTIFLRFGLLLLLFSLNSCGAVNLTSNSADEFERKARSIGMIYIANAMPRSWITADGLGSLSGDRKPAGGASKDSQWAANDAAMSSCSASVHRDCILILEGSTITKVAEQEILSKKRLAGINTYTKPTIQAELKDENNQSVKEKVKTEKKLTLAELDKLYSETCSRTNKKDSDKYNSCLLDKHTEAKQLAEKVSKMSPDDRRAFTCTDKFGFRKGSDKFKDCVFKIYQAELEMEKIELQRELAKANAETAKARAEAARANDERQERLLQAQTEAAKMQSLAARQQAIAANTAESMALIESGLRMMSPQQSAPRMQTNCTFTGRFMNCY